MPRTPRALPSAGPHAQLDDHEDESEPLFAMHRNEPNLGCPVGRGIRPALAPVYDGVEKAVRRQLRRTSIADMLDQTAGTR